MKRTVFSFTAGVMAERSTNRVFVDGREVQIEAYNIAGNNYCKLRDICKAVGFNQVPVWLPEGGIQWIGKERKSAICTLFQRQPTRIATYAICFSGSLI